MPGTCTPCAPQLDVDLSAAATPAAVDFPITLNDRWRVVDDPLQWILAVRQRANSKSGSEYRHRSFCACRVNLHFQRSVHRSPTDARSHNTDFR